MKTVLSLPNRIIVFALIVAIFTSSCWTTKTGIGKFNEQRGYIERYSKGKQVWLFWGLIPCGRTQVRTPNGPCQIVTKMNFGDVLINGITGGLVNTYSITCNIKRTFNIGDKVLYGGRHPKKATVSAINNEKTCFIELESGKIKKVKFGKIRKAEKE